ncbi:hypothetical protein BGX26_002272 [Mortierella sp. AD094]|nr:hypothetical protein BGX26_002272 [Mortierella sp. AD094]
MKQWHNSTITIILPHLGDHLDKSTLLSSITVCRSWHACLEPFIWRNFNLLRDRLGPTAANNGVKRCSQRCPSIALIQRNAQHIHRIRYYGELPLLQQLLPGCTQLRYLEVARYSEEVKQLLQQNASTLHTFICKTDPLLRAKQEPVVLDKVWHLLKEIPTLRVLKLESVIVSDYEGRMFGTVCQKLNHLSLIDSKLIERPKSETQDFDSLRALILDRSYVPNEDQLQLFQLCPVLEHLTWKSRTGCLQILNFLFFLNSGKFRRVTSLDISNSSKTTDHDFAKIIALLPGLTNLNATKTLFGYEGTRAMIELKKDQIQELNFLGCPNITAMVAHAYLSSCPRLRKFSAPSVSAVDVARRRWVCLEIQELDIRIAGIEQLPAPSFPRHRGIYGQLAALTKLTVLRLGDLGCEPSSPPAGIPDPRNRQFMLDLKLDSGLGLLSTLNRLRELDVTNMHAVMEFGELQWVVQNWRRLERVVGSVHPNPPQRDLSNEFLRDQVPGLKTFSSREEAWLSEL